REEHGARPEIGPCPRLGDEALHRPDAEREEPRHPGAFSFDLPRLYERERRCDPGMSPEAVVGCARVRRLVLPERAPERSEGALGPPAPEPHTRFLEPIFILPERESGELRDHLLGRVVLGRPVLLAVAVG